MKIAQVAVLSTLAGAAGAMSLRGLKNQDEADAASATNEERDSLSAETRRDLQAGNGCDGQGSSPPATLWHPNYAAGWPQGYCRFTVDCNSPGYETELACCKASYNDQSSGYCLSRLPSPPTTSPTDAGGPDEFYPDYATPWPEAGCINTQPMPNGRPTYATMLACCLGSYGGQASGKCLSMLPSPPTTSPSTSPTSSAIEADFWYPDYDTPWSIAGCSNQLPLPYPDISWRPNYATQLECCKGSYDGQASGACLAALPSPPTTSPTDIGGLDVWYPDRSVAWTEGTCINDAPLPNNVGQPYSTMLACCKGAFGGQVTGACLAALPSPPTTSPIGIGGLDVWYPDRSVAWSEGTCINDAPLPNNVGQPYATMLACCAGAFGGQVTGACLAALPSPPTTSPIGIGGLDVWYPDRSVAWSEGTCINDAPLPNNVGQPYATMLACCTGAFGGQVTGACLAALPNPPTTSPTDSGELDVWYRDPSATWADGTCINDGPLPNNAGSTYTSMIECCKGAFGGQVSGACLAALPSPPTMSPEGASGLDVYYRDPTLAWSVGKCTNDSPLPNNAGPTYGTKAACCSGEFGGQVSQACWCDADPCFSCNCGTVADLTSCGLTCS